MKGLAAQRLWASRATEGEALRDAAVGGGHGDQVYAVEFVAVFGDPIRSLRNPETPAG